MFRFFLLSLFFIASLRAESPPKSRTLYREFTKIFAHHNAEYLLDQMNKNVALFDMGCKLRENESSLQDKCSIDEMSERVDKHPNNNKIYHLKMISLCNFLSKDSREISFFLNKLNASNPPEKSDVEKAYEYFYPFSGDKAEKVDSLYRNISQLGEDKQAKALFMTFCLDPNWL